MCDVEGRTTVMATMMVRERMATMMVRVRVRKRNGTAVMTTKETQRRKGSSRWRPKMLPRKRNAKSWKKTNSSPRFVQSTNT